VHKLQRPNEAVKTNSEQRPNR